LRFRYTYLAGGVNTGQGWATWNPGGAFVTSYIQESAANGFTPVFSYYMLRQSSPGSGMGEQAGDTANLANTSTMSAFFADLKLFFQRAGAFSSPVVLHVEPDLWGYVQQRFGDDAAAAPARVRSTGMAELAGLPDTAAGVARGILKLRDSARRHLRQAQDMARTVSPDAMPALLPVALAGATLARMERGDYDPFVPVEIAPWRRQWLIWRAARRPSRIFR
jgi:hypothetical protein